MVSPPPATSLVTYGIVGVGLMGVEHLRNLLHIPDVLVTCIADDHPPSLTSCRTLLAAESPSTLAALSIFPTADALFAAALCDVAIIATPNHTHHALLLAAYAQAPPTMHLLVEKPLCTTVPHCRDVIAAAARRPGLTFVGLEYSYMPPVARIIADATAGLIGPPNMVAIREHRFPFLQKVRHWNRLSKNSGGTFVEKCCHFFDLFNRIMHPHTPVAVFASGGQDVNHLDEVYDGQPSDIIDNGYVIVEYSSGRRACLDLCMFAEASHSQEELSIVGPKGKLEAFLPQLEVRTGLRDEHSCGSVKTEIIDDDRIKYMGHHHGSSYLEHLDILKAVRALKLGGHLGIPTSGLHHGLLSVAIGVAAHMSVEQRRFVQLNEILTDEELSQSVKHIIRVSSEVNETEQKS